jgi:hypothetical protein
VSGSGGSVLDRYIPERAWFERQADEDYAGTHGIGHICRVLVWSARLTELADYLLRRNELFWAAGLHDIRRQSDGRDALHGERAAVWIREQFPKKRPHEAASLDLELIASLCRDHVRRDDLIEAWTPELLVLKDADGLERVRIWDLDPTRLRLEVSPNLEPLAWDLMERSVDDGNTPDAVRRVATDMGLWR